MCEHVLCFQPPVGESHFLIYDFPLPDLTTLMVNIVGKPAEYHYISAY